MFLKVNIKEGTSHPKRWRIIRSMGGH